MLLLVFARPRDKKPVTAAETKREQQLDKLWDIAKTSMKTTKTSSRAERALLTILRFDEKNAAAYNRLGILYAKEGQYSEAIECFEIAQSLDSNASSLHNVGLIYLETGAYEKASQAFKQAIDLEGDLPARYIAYAKSEEKLGNYHSSLEALETAFELERSTTILRQILSLHETADNQEAILATQARIESLLAKQKKSPDRPKPPKPPKTPKHPLHRKPKVI